MTEPKTVVKSRIFIKPSTETPSNLKTFKLSLLDQMTPDLHFNTTFFYLPSRSSDNVIATDPVSDLAKSHNLQNSLSRTLSHFYPYAGRFRDDSTVDCNDEGILFVEAQSSISLTHFLQTPDLRTVDEDFLPISDSETKESFQGPILLIKFTSFSCGGCALSLSISHKIADMVSLATFMQNLCPESHANPSQLLPDFYTCASLLPARDMPNIKTSAVISPKTFATIRLVFHASRIIKLKAKIFNALNNKDGKEIFRPSTVEVVEALIWKCIVAARKSITGVFSPSVLVQAVNLRTRMNPPQPQNAMGNLIWMYPIIVEKESEMEMVELVKKLRATKDCLQEKATKFNSEEIDGLVQQSHRDRAEHLKNLEPCIFSSWCKFPLLENDLGWGKPVWVTSIAKNLMANTVYLMDTKEVGGVEALVHLSEEEMNSFRVNEELVCYAAVNPSVI